MRELEDWKGGRLEEWGVVHSDGMGVGVLLQGLLRTAGRARRGRRVSRREGGAKLWSRPDLGPPCPRCCTHFEEGKAGKRRLWKPREEPRVPGGAGHAIGAEIGS
jgi:hypothetical protein